MNNFDKLNLEKMIKTNNVEDCTNEIRKKAHSNLIKNDINTLSKLKNQYSRLMNTNPQEFDQICVNRCQFIFNNYTDIFNKVKKNEIDLNILYKFLDVLKNIEEGKVNQHEGSHEIGKLLKELYIDSAIRKADKLDNKNNKKTPIKKKEKKITYKEYKEINNN